MKKNIAILIHCILVAVICARGQYVFKPFTFEGKVYYTNPFRIYFDYQLQYYAIDSAEIKNILPGLKANPKKSTLSQFQIDSLLMAYSHFIYPSTTDTVFCDRIYINIQTWTTTNNKVAPSPLVLKVVKWIRPQQYPDGTKWFANDGTAYDVIWCRLTKSLIWMQLKFYKE